MSRNHFQLVETKELRTRLKEGTDGVRETLELRRERADLLPCPSPYVTVKESTDRHCVKRYRE